MARKLGVDPITVKRQAAKLDLPIPRTIGARAVSTAKIYQKVDHTAELAASQAQWLEHIRANPGLGVKALRLLQPALYFRLYRADRAWLKRHAPTAPKPTEVQLRVDWAERDTQIVEQLKAAAVDPCFAGQHRTVAALLRLAGVGTWFWRRKQELPLSWQTVQALAEPLEDFACRRIQAVLDDPGRWGDGVYVTPARWQVCRLAGLRPAVQHLPKVAAILRTL